MHFVIALTAKDLCCFRNCLKLGILKQHIIMFCRQITRFWKKFLYRRSQKNESEKEDECVCKCVFVSGLYWIFGISCNPAISKGPALERVVGIVYV